MLVKFIRIVFSKLISIFIGSERALWWIAKEEDRKLFHLRAKGYGYLSETGWINSAVANRAVNKNNEPIPWLSYPFIEFIDEKLNKEMTMLEFGAGSSTIYFSTKLKAVLSFENNKKWFDIVNSQLGKNANLRLYISNDEINSFLSELKSKFDIILIDSAQERLEHTRMAIPFLSQTGVIVVDDTEDPAYLPIIEFLTNSGFKVITFCGLAACIPNKKCTSIFYRQGNLLNI